MLLYDKDKMAAIESWRLLVTEQCLYDFEEEEEEEEERHAVLCYACTPLRQRFYTDRPSTTVAFATDVSTPPADDGCLFRIDTSVQIRPAQRRIAVVTPTT
jgi:hypothetical protein